MSRRGEGWGRTKRRWEPIARVTLVVMLVLLPLRETPACHDDYDSGTVSTYLASLGLSPGRPFPLKTLTTAGCKPKLVLLCIIVEFISGSRTICLGQKSGRTSINTSYPRHMDPQPTLYLRIPMISIVWGSTSCMLFTCRGRKKHAKIKS